MDFDSKGTCKSPLKYREVVVSPILFSDTPCATNTVQE